MGRTINTTNIFITVFCLIAAGIALYVMNLPQFDWREKMKNATRISCDSELDLLVKKYENNRGYLMLNDQYYKGHFNSWDAPVFNELGEQITEYRFIRYEKPYRLHKKPGEDRLYIEKDGKRCYIKIECRDSLDSNW